VLEPHQAAASLSLPWDQGALLPSQPPSSPPKLQGRGRELLGEGLRPRGLQERGLCWSSVSSPSPPPSLPCHRMAVGSGDLVPIWADSIRLRILCNPPSSPWGCTNGELPWIPATCATACPWERVFQPGEQPCNGQGGQDGGRLLSPSLTVAPGQLSLGRGGTPGHPHGALGPGVGGIRRRQFGRLCWRPPALHPGSPVHPWGREMPRRTRLLLGQGLRHPWVIFVALFGCKSGCHHPFSTLDGSAFAAGWGCGGSGGNPPRNPITEPPMKYSGRSERFPPRRKRHEYCR